MTDRQTDGRTLVGQTGKQTDTHSAAQTISLGKIMSVLRLGDMKWNFLPLFTSVRQPT